jgi:transglutaminase-like putative cysteine protease
MTGRYRPLLLGLWMSFLYWPFTHAGGYYHPFLVAFMPLFLAAGDLFRRWVLRISTWIVVAYGALSLSWNHWANLHEAAGAAGAVRQLFFLPPSDWNQINGHLAAPLLILGGLFGWWLYRQARHKIETWALLALGAVVIPLDHVFWGLAAGFALGSYLTTGLVVLLDVHEAELRQHANPRGPAAVAYLGWAVAILGPVLVGWATPPHEAQDPLGIFRAPTIPGLSSSASVATTGYGPGVNNIGHSLTQSHVPVFIAHTAGPHYWQAATYTQFNGTSWYNLSGGVIYEATPSDFGVPLVNPYFTTQVPHVDLKASIVAASPDGVMSTLFYAGTPTHLSVSATVHTESSRFVSTGVHGYSLSAIVPEYRSGQLAAAPFTPPPHQLAVDMELPSNLSPRVSSLARRITARSRGPWQSAVMVKRYLDSHYRYSLTVPAMSGNVVNKFLFSIKEGYCDQFSTTFIMMMRSLHIPARWAVGYSTGTFSPSQNGWVVRAADAHSWAEIWLSTVGWVPFDPTPGFSAPIRIVQPNGTNTVIPNDVNGNQPIKPPANATLTARRRRLEALNHIGGVPHRSTTTAHSGDWWFAILGLGALGAAVAGMRRRIVGRTPDGVWLGVRRASTKKLGTRRYDQSPRQWGSDWVRYFPSDADLVWPLVRLLEAAFYRGTPLNLEEQNELSRLWHELRRRRRRLA